MAKAKPRPAARGAGATRSRPPKSPTARRGGAAAKLWLPMLGLIAGLAGVAFFTDSGRRAFNHYLLAHKRVTFPEGATRFEMAQRLQDAQICLKSAFLAATEDRLLLAELGVHAESAEGYLFPATYTWPKDSDPRDVVRRMKREFDKRTRDLFAAPVALSATPEGWDARARLILASMVEKEAQAPEERGHIAGVMMLRLTSPSFPSRLLQSDPTAAYPCQRAKEMGGLAPAPCASYTGTIAPALLHDTSNAYSTYTHAGLPPGPICNPGLAAIRAAVFPDATDDLYFMARGGGRHTFSKTYEEHQRAVRAYR